MDWNPHAPDVIGLELPPRSGPVLPAYRIDAPIRAAAMRVDSTVTETVSTLGIFANADTMAGRIMAEMLLAGSELPTGQTTTILRPNGGVFAGSDYENGTGDPPTVADINGAVFDPHVYIHLTTAGLFSIDVEFPTTGAFTGRRITGVRVYVVGSGDPAKDYSVDFGKVSTVGSPDFVAYGSKPPFGALYPNPSTVVLDFGEINPDDGQPWTQAGLDPWDTSAHNLHISVPTHSGGGIFGYVYVYQVWMAVDHCDENRASAQVITSGATGARVITATPRKPAGTSNLAKVSGTDLTLLLRQPRYGDLLPSSLPADYSFSVPYLEALIATPPPGLFEYGNIALNGDGTVSVLGAPTGNRIIGLEMEVAGTQSVDSQPFINLTELSPSASAGTVVQEISQGAALHYNGVQIPVRYDTAPTDNLLVVLKRRSDNAIMGTATITPALAAAVTPDPVRGWRLIQAVFTTPALLAAGTQYYFDVYRSNVLAAARWIIPALNGTPALGSPVTGLASYRGTSDVATYGGGDKPNADLPIVTYAAPDGPGAFNATALATPVAGSEGLDDGCRISDIGYIHLSWTVPGVLSSFGYYEIQRSDALTDWYTIASIPDSSVVVVDDVEARNGIESCYRIRTVSTVGTTSPWTSDCATRVSYGCGYTFGSNALPELAVGYTDVYDSAADRTFSFPETAEVVKRTIHGRDGYVAFVPAERRGVLFTRKLRVSAIATPDLPGPGPADTLRDLSRAAVNYVCVCDEEGGRWFANVKVLDYTDHRPQRLEYVTVEIAELTTVPDVVTVTS